MENWLAGTNSTRRGGLCKNFDAFECVTVACRGTRGCMGVNEGGDWRNHVSGTAARRVQRFPNVSPEILASLPGFDTLPLVCTYRRATLCRPLAGVDLHAPPDPAIRARFRVWSTTEHAPFALFLSLSLPRPTCYITLFVGVLEFSIDYPRAL